MTGREFGAWATTSADGFTGAFQLMGPCGAKLRIISSTGDSTIPWEHVSVSLPKRTPNWREMCFVKDLFWSEDECVVQYHPPRSDYVNVHQFCLHLWKPLGLEVPRPPSIAVGPRP